VLEILSLILLIPRPDNFPKRTPPMNNLRFILKAFLISSLISVVAFAQSLSPTQLDTVSSATATPAEKKQAVLDALAASGVDLTDADAVATAVDAIMSQVLAETGTTSTDVITSVSSVVTEAAVEAAASAGADATAVASSVSSAVVRSTVRAAATTGTDVAAATSAATSGSQSGSTNAAQSSGLDVVSVSAAASSGANQGAAQGAADAGIPVAATQPPPTTLTPEPPGPEPEPEPEPAPEPPEPQPVVVSTSFTIQLSYGSVLVSVTDSSDSGSEIDITPNGTGGEIISSEGGDITNLALPDVLQADTNQTSRPLSAAELDVIAAAIRDLPGAPDAVVVVPSNPIVVSPSS
jgi:hypothetical protein